MIIYMMLRKFNSLVAAARSVIIFVMWPQILYFSLKPKLTVQIHFKDSLHAFSTDATQQRGGGDESWQSVSSRVYKCLTHIKVGTRSRITEKRLAWMNDGLDSSDSPVPYFCHSSDTLQVRTRDKHVNTALRCFLFVCQRIEGIEVKYTLVWRWKRQCKSLVLNRGMIVPPKGEKGWSASLRVRLFRRFGDYE